MPEREALPTHVPGLRLDDPVARRPSPQQRARSGRLLWLLGVAAAVAVIVVGWQAYGAWQP